MKNLVFKVLFLFFFFFNIYGQEKKIIQVETDDLSMVFIASQNQPVIFKYWGSKLNGISSFLGKNSKNQPDTNDSFDSQSYPAYGGRYYLTPAVKLTHSDGVLTTDLVYVDSQSRVLDNNRIETVISLKDKLYPVFIDMRFIAYKKENIISQSAIIHHKEKKDLMVESLASSYIPLYAKSYYLTHFNGTWGSEMQMEEEQLTHGVKVIETKKGVRATQSENPSFILSLNGPVNENHGEVYAGSLAWSGNYKLSFEVDETGKLGITSGMNPFASTFYLKADQKLETPQMALTYSPNGVGQISRSYHDWARKYAMAHGDRIHPIILNSWEGAYFNFDEKTLTDMMDNAAQFGVEMFVLDDGWFGNKYPRNNDDAGLGDWQTNTKKLPRGIPYLADYAASKGLKFGIWIEPEMVNPNSELAKKHPEWVVKSGKRDILTMRNQCLLDLSNPKVQDFVFNTFDQVVSMSPNISYIKWDANRHVENVGSDYLSANQQTHFWYEYVKGLYSVYERIRAKYPDIQIQVCSSGGGRVEFGALKYHDEFWTSDNTNALDRIFIQYGTNLFFPAIASASHVSTSPNHQTNMMTPLKFRFDVAMSGRLGMELQPKDIAGNEYEFAVNAISNYKLVRPIVQFGDLYRLISPYDGSGWASQMYVSKDKKQSVFFAYSLKYHPRTTHFASKLSGLDPNKSYRIKELNVKNNQYSFNENEHIFTGDYLMKVGISLNIGNPLESTVLLLSEE